MKKIPSIPELIPRKYHQEIKCILEQFQRDILVDILKNADLDDRSFLEVIKFSHFEGVSPLVLYLIKDTKGNEVSKRLYELIKK
jgi:hypothetical protein